MAESVDYLVVGAGATGMAFLDTLLKHHPEPRPVVAIVDRRAAPGGHWNDGYPYVMLHQAAKNYGVESVAMEDVVADRKELRASRAEILDYYGKLMERFVGEQGVRHIPNAAYNFSTGVCEMLDGSSSVPIKAATVVDARFTEPDLPIYVKPTFKYNSSAVDVMPPQSLPAPGSAPSGRKYCVVGAGKTGQDTVIYLQTQLGVEPTDIAWVMPNQPWITARDPATMDTCMEFLRTCFDAAAKDGSDAPAPSSVEFVQRGYLELEREGKAYRLLDDELPTKFMNATLNSSEVEILKRVPRANILRNGRVASISDAGELTFTDGSTARLPWGNAASATTTFVHCSSGAFNLSGSAEQARAEKPSVFAPGKITIQEVFSYPGFCFNGAMVARLECETGMSTDEKNAMCELPPPPAPFDPSNLGPSGGDVGALHDGHGLVIALRNARRWNARPALAEWLAGLRLYALTMNNYSLEEGKKLLDRNWDDLVKAGIAKHE